MFYFILFSLNPKRGVGDFKEAFNVTPKAHLVRVRFYELINFEKKIQLTK